MKHSIHDKAIYITGNKKKQKKQALFKKPALAACLCFSHVKINFTTTDIRIMFSFSVTSDSKTLYFAS
jgi:hypothetical protein